MLRPRLEVRATPAKITEPFRDQNQGTDELVHPIITDTTTLATGMESIANIVPKRACPAVKQEIRQVTNSQSGLTLPEQATGDRQWVGMKRLRANDNSGQDELENFRSEKPSQVDQQDAFNQSHIQAYQEQPQLSSKHSSSKNSHSNSPKHNRETENKSGARHNSKRYKKLIDYFHKKLRRYQESEQSKIDRFYMIRKVVADKRLRVKGRFVTNEQALKMLGLSQEELKGSQEL